MHGIKTEPLRPTIYVRSVPLPLPLSLSLSLSLSLPLVLSLGCIRMECAAGICPLPCTIYSISMGAVWGSSVRNAEWVVSKWGLHDNKRCLLVVVWNLINCKLNLTINIEAHITGTRVGVRQRKREQRGCSEHRALGQNVWVFIIDSSERVESASLWIPYFSSIQFTATPVYFSASAISRSAV